MILPMTTSYCSWVESMSRRETGAEPATHTSKRDVAVEGIAESQELLIKARMEALKPDKTGSGGK